MCFFHRFLSFVINYKLVRKIDYTAHPYNSKNQNLIHRQNNFSFVSKLKKFTFQVIKTFRFKEFYIKIREMDLQTTF